MSKIEGEKLSLRDQYIRWLLDRDPGFAAKLLGWTEKKDERRSLDSEGEA